MILIIDNYDSFTYNLVHYLGDLGASVQVRRNDALDVQAAMALKPAGIVLSPGPCTPDQAGICLALTLAAAETRTPLLGVCLGHQTLGQAFGGRVTQHDEIVHGKPGSIHHQGRGVFANLPSPFAATRYHSLVVAQHGLPVAGCRFSFVTITRIFLPAHWPGSLPRTESALIVLVVLSTNGTDSPDCSLNVMAIAVRSPPGIFHLRLTWPRATVSGHAIPTASSHKESFEAGMLFTRSTGVMCVQLK